MAGYVPHVQYISGTTQQVVVLQGQPGQMVHTTGPQYVIQPGKLNRTKWFIQLLPNMWYNQVSGSYEQSPISGATSNFNQDKWFIQPVHNM